MSSVALVDVLAGQSRQEVDDGRRQDRQPRPGHQCRPEVVAADVGVDVRRREEAGDRHGRAGQERVARPSHRGRDERDRDERGEDPELGRCPRHQVAELARQVAERVDHAVPELFGQDDVLEPLPGIGRAVHKRGTERPGAERQLEVDEQDRERQHPDTREDQPGTAPDRRVDRDDVERDRHDQKGRQRVVAEGEPEDRGGCDQEAVAAIAGPVSVVGVGIVVPSAQAVVPGDEQPQEDRHEREVERVRLGVGGHRPSGRHQREADAGRDAKDQPAGQASDEVDCDAGRDGDADGREEVHHECRFAQRLEDDRRQPADQHVGRETCGMGRAHQGRDRLQLAGVPERDAGQEGERGGHEGDQPDQQRGGQALSSHHPSNRLHMTPHRLIASDTTTRLIAPSMPQR